MADAAREEAPHPLAPGDEVVARLSLGGMVVGYLRGVVVTIMQPGDPSSVWPNRTAVLVTYVGAATGTAGTLRREWPTGAWLPLEKLGRWHDDPAEWRIGGVGGAEESKA